MLYWITSSGTWHAIFKVFTWRPAETINVTNVSTASLCIIRKLGAWAILVHVQLTCLSWYAKRNRWRIFPTANVCNLKIGFVQFQRCLPCLFVLLCAASVFGIGSTGVSWHWPVMSHSNPGQQDPSLRQKKKHSSNYFCIVTQQYLFTGLC